MLPLLRSCVLGLTPSITLLPTDPLIWKQWCRGFDQHKVSVMLYQYLAQHSSILPAGYLSCLGQFAQTRTLKNLTLCKALRDIHGIFQQHAIPYLALKGPALSMAYYGEPNARASDDLDLFISPDSIEHVIETLEHHDYLCISPKLPMSPKQKRHYLTWQKDITLRHPTTGVTVECHFRLINLPHFFTLPFEEAYAMHQYVRCHDQDIPVLSDHHALLYSCAHAAKHVSLKWQWYVDVYRQRQHLSSLSDNQLLDWAESFQAKKAIAHVLKDVAAFKQGLFCLRMTNTTSSRYATFTHFWNLSCDWRYRSNLYFRLVGPLHLTWESTGFSDRFFSLNYIVHLFRIPRFFFRKLIRT